MNIRTFQQNLSRTKNINEAGVLLKKYLSAINITTFAFTYYAYHPKSVNKIKYDLTSENLKIWHENYLEKNYDYIDSTLDKVYHTTLPTFWSLEQQLKEAKTKQEKKMRLDSIEFGAEKGLSIPIHGPNNDFAILMVEQLKDETCLENWRELQNDLLSVAHYYYDQVRKQLLKKASFDKSGVFSKREIQCLNLLTQNLTVSQIAKKLHITERTVNYHIQNINRKFGAKNKYQSIARALQENVIP